MKASELRDLTMEELEEEHVRLLKEHLSLRIQRSQDQLPQVSQIKKTKRDIARVKTVIREKSHDG